jgi:hypothetical protein
MRGAGSLLFNPSAETSRMKAVRWKKNYLTGDSRLDDRNRTLVALVADLRQELSSTEHCQEMNELADRLVELTRQRLSSLSQDPSAEAASEAAIEDLLRRDLPLAALSTPACRDCGLCDIMAERVEKWLSDGG